MELVALYRVPHVRRSSRSPALCGKQNHRRKAALAAWQPRPFLRTISLACALTENSVCVSLFFETISETEIVRVYNNVFRRCQASPAARFSEQSV